MASMRKQEREDRNGLRPPQAKRVSGQPVTFRNAVVWLKEVKVELEDDKYSEFLQLMQDRKAQRVGNDELIIFTRVKELFKGHSHLIPGLNLLFFPQGHARSAGRIIRIDKEYIGGMDCEDCRDRMERNYDGEEGDGDIEDNSFAELKPERVSPITHNAIWIRQSLVGEGGKELFPAPARPQAACKETVTGRHASSLVQHLEKCLHKCERCAHVKYPVIDRVKARESAVYQKRAKANLQNIYQEIFRTTSAESDLEAPLDDQFVLSTCTINVALG